MVVYCRIINRNLRSSDVGEPSVGISALKALEGGTILLYYRNVSVFSAYDVVWFWFHAGKTLQEGLTAGFL